MKVLVTGGAGFIGSHLVEELATLGHDVTVLDNSQENLEKNLKNVKCERIIGDVNDISVELDNHKFDWIVHLAAVADVVPSIQDPVKYHRNNVDGTVAVLEYARKSGCEKFIYTASASCYGDKPKLPSQETDPLNPKYPYALTKMVGEQYAMHYHNVYKLPVISLRLFNVYGPRARTTGGYGAVFGVFLAQKLAEKPYTVVGDGGQSRDFIYVTDVAKAFVKALESDKEGQIYNIGSGSHTSVNNIIAHLGGLRVEKVPDRPGEPRVTMAWIQKAMTELKWQPAVSLALGVQKLLAQIDYWKDAPVWDKKSIADATEDWFKYMTPEKKSGA